MNTSVDGMFEQKSRIYSPQGACNDDVRVNTTCKMLIIAEDQSSFY